ncbi:class I SAM-dependent methyltransferase [Alteribacter natronophilus]|uniref:class I SAM-dependent methyltransferase n=1 Tax=Alteribacter natronophilus TaxID=2583810 RepID=UPI00110DCE6B|nr:class I SAM-dependent methyltransferase [Alteribacter natronophilus]TMW71727.1 class I SAM-dependent methyltransferase [Alteribacter natronophilus]
MNTETNTEKLYTALDLAAEKIQKNTDLLYLDALAESGESILQGESTLKLEGKAQEEFEALIQSVPDLENLKAEEIRKAFQLAVLKGMKEATQPNHAMTPDAVSLFAGHLAELVLRNEKKTQVILDPAVGSANLLTAVMNQARREFHAVGGDADETLIKLAYVNANLQKHNVDLFHQDSVAAPYVSNVDLVVSDLPVGYYPDDRTAGEFELKSSEGHSYVHHLLIEQSLKHVKPGGFMIFLVPNFLFESDEAGALHEYLKKEAVIYSLLQLPKSMFKHQQQAKSIFVVRRKGEGIEAPRQALLAELPSFTNKQALADMVKRIDDWFESHLSQE